MCNHILCLQVFLEVLLNLVDRHTGVVVYGNEYFFGGGIQQAPAGSTAYGTPIQVIDVGVTHVPKDVFEIYLAEIGPRYTAETYSLLTHNCNNFSNEVTQFLVGAGIPDYILQLPNEIMSSPMGALICKCEFCVSVILLFKLICDAVRALWIFSTLFLYMGTNYFNWGICD